MTWKTRVKGSARQIGTKIKVGGAKVKPAYKKVEVKYYKTFGYNPETGEKGKGAKAVERGKEIFGKVGTRTDIFRRKARINYLIRKVEADGDDRRGYLKQLRNELDGFEELYPDEYKGVESRMKTYFPHLLKQMRRG